MKPEHKVIIDGLSASVAEKRERLYNLGMMNVAQDEADRMRQSMAYSQAQAELWNAQDQLRAAIQKYDAPTSPDSK